ncbi:MAG: response regulator [Saprospiraceae bacterium]|nr:response regulator [Saprospiraceae bacterium]
MNQRIFVVDDDPYWTAIISHFLTELGCENIFCLSSGKECLESLDLRPVMVFLDYQMDDMNGIEVLKRIKAHYPGTRVVFCTAYEDLSIAVNALEQGSCDYLLKNNANLKEISSIISPVAEGQPLTINK